MLRSPSLAVSLGVVALAFAASGCAETMMVSPAAEPIASVNSTMSVEPAEDSMPAAPTSPTRTQESPARVDPSPAPPIMGVVSAPPPVILEDVRTPVYIDEATVPSVVYKGNPAYLYQDHWYYRDGGRWALYAAEPPELARQRSFIKGTPRAAKPASRGAHPAPSRAAQKPAVARQPG